MVEERRPGIIAIEDALSDEPAQDYESFERTIQENIHQAALEHLEGRGYVGWKALNEIHLHLSTA